MKKNGLILILLIIISLNHGPAITQAAETRVYIRFSFGGAVVVGGGILWWRFAHGTRVSQISSQAAPPELQAMTLDRIRDRTKDFSTQFIEESRSFRSPPMLLHFPFLIYRW